MGFNGETFKSWGEELKKHYDENKAPFDLIGGGIDHLRDIAYNSGDDELVKNMRMFDAAFTNARDEIYGQRGVSPELRANVNNLVSMFNRYMRPMAAAYDLKDKAITTRNDMLKLDDTLRFEIEPESVPLRDIMTTNNWNIGNSFSIRKTKEDAAKLWDQFSTEMFEAGITSADIEATEAYKKLYKENPKEAQRIAKVARDTFLATKERYGHTSEELSKFYEDIMQMDIEDMLDPNMPASEKAKLTTAFKSFVGESLMAKTMHAVLASSPVANWKKASPAEMDAHRKAIFNAVLSQVPYTIGTGRFNMYSLPQERPVGGSSVRPPVEQNIPYNNIEYSYYNENNLENSPYHDVHKYIRGLKPGFSFLKDWWDKFDLESMYGSYTRLDEATGKKATAHRGLRNVGYYITGKDWKHSKYYSSIAEGVEYANQDKDENSAFRRNKKASYLDNLSKVADRKPVNRHTFMTMQTYLMADIVARAGIASKTYKSSNEDKLFAERELKGDIITDLVTYFEKLVSTDERNLTDGDIQVKNALESFRTVYKIDDKIKPMLDLYNNVREYNSLDDVTEVPDNAYSRYKDYTRALEYAARVEGYTQDGDKGLPEALDNPEGAKQIFQQLLGNTTDLISNGYEVPVEFTTLKEILLDDLRKTRSSSDASDASSSKAKLSMKTSADSNGDLKVDLDRQLVPNSQLESMIKYLEQNGAQGFSIIYDPFLSDYGAKGENTLVLRTPAIPAKSGQYDAVPAMVLSFDQTDVGRTKFPYRKFRAAELKENTKKYEELQKAYMKLYNKLGGTADAVAAVPDTNADKKLLIATGAEIEKYKAGHYYNLDYLMRMIVDALTSKFKGSERTTDNAYKTDKASLATPASSNLQKPQQ